jgi:hypothetical protein
MIKVNREKAETATIDRLRLEREPRLAELDVQFMRALEVGEDTAAIAAQKQAVRDVTLCDLSGLSLEQLGVLTLDAALQLPRASA